MLRDNSFGKRGSVELHPNGLDPYDGAYYAGGPKMFEVVERTVTVVTGPWRTADQPDGAS